MPTNLSGRVTLILAVLFASLWAIFPSAPKVLLRPFNSNVQWSFKPNLKPGIDMVGGTSLIYEIKVPEGGFQGNLAEQVMQSLKKRVDPDGVRNLIWRPQGNTRLEIQMPMSSGSSQVGALRKDFAAAQEKLEQTNVPQAEATYVVQDLTGEARATELARLEKTSDSRAKILGAMATTWDQIQQAKTARDAAKQAQGQLDYDKLLDQLNDTNLSVADFQRVLDLTKADQRDAALASLKRRFADFPERLAAMDQFADQYHKFSQVKGLLDDASELKQMLKGSGVIEFHILASDLPVAEMQAAVERLQRRGPRFQNGEVVRWYEVDRGPEVINDVENNVQDILHATDPRQQGDLILRASEGNENIQAMYEQIVDSQNDPIRRRQLQKQIEDSTLGVGHELQDYAGKKWALCYVTADKSLSKSTKDGAWALERAYPVLEGGERQVGFSFDARGASRFGELTGNNIGAPLAIVLDDKLISAPRINSQISRSGVITGGGRGGFKQSELTYMVNTLNAGALPAQLAEEPISENTVGPQLGADNLRRGLLASFLGLGAVALFMIIYYHLSGLIAVIALLLNMIMILGVMAALNATWTLPAVAGIVLTIGMSVDANVLVFERLREEQARGLSLRMALRNAYDRAASAIIDSNAITAVTCLILYWLGSEEVKGFGLTLLIGLLSSLFTALFVTKTIFAALMDKFDLQKLGCLPLSVPALGKFLHPNINWMTKIKYFLGSSILIVLAGFISLVVVFRQGQLFDVEFVSGTSVEFELKAATPIGDVRSWLESLPESDLPSPSVVSIGDDQKKYEVVTPSNDSKKVTQSLLAALGDRVNLVQPSKFDEVGATYTDAMNKAIFPILPETRTIGGLAPAALRAHTGGVAILLNKLNPPLTKEQIIERLQQARTQPQANSATGSTYRSFDVETNTAGTEAVVLTSDPEIPYETGDANKIDAWMQDVAKPVWESVSSAVNSDPRLQKVSNFNPQVAGQMQRDAFMALTLSLIVIMAYIWLRFGNLRYGTATVVAMLHDTFIVIGAIGLSHFLGKVPFIHDYLLIVPFRVNLTLVAAVLTVMSYSMVDTIVVFDRIRENRGKFGMVSPQILNDSINQTLSRTLLTGGTTVMTVFIMYLFGGPGIHGFTFIMLIGILVGTYSSIAVAAPILLMGHRKDVSAGGGRPSTTSQRQFQGA